MNAEQFDKHLFNLSQQADDSNATPFNEEAWQRMEQLLDGDKKKRRFVLWWWLLPLLLIGGGTAMYMHHNNASNTTVASNTLKTTIEETKNNNQTTKPENKAVDEVGLNEANSSNAQSAKANDNSKVAVKETASKPENTIAHNTSANKKEQVKTSATLKASSSYSNITKRGGLNNQQDGSPQIITQNVQLNATQTSSGNSTSIADNIVSNNIDNAAAKEVSKPAELVNATDKKEAQKNADTAAKPAITATKNIEKKKRTFLSKFEVSAFAAADISAVDLSLKEPKSFTFGIGLSYQITKKLSIATGFGVSKKLYTADSIDYKNQPWVMASYKLKTVDANCLVYELPINLQYQFAQTKKARWLAVGGVSSYFMKSESYDYNYLWYGQPRKTTYLIENKNNHLFSILNVAVGYRRQLGKQLSYQLTPFVKIPLTGIGEGQVKFYSAGLQLSLNLKGK